MGWVGAATFGGIVTWSRLRCAGHSAVHAVLGVARHRARAAGGGSALVKCPTACVSCRCAGDSPEAVRARELLKGGKGPRSLSELMQLIGEAVGRGRAAEIGAAVEELRGTLPPQHPGMSTVSIPESVSCGGRCEALSGCCVHALSSTHDA